MHRVAVLGAGSWGTALAIHLARGGHDVRLWVREPELVEAMRERRENTMFLPGFTLPANLRPCGAYDEALAGAHLVVCAVPSHGTRSVLREAAPFVEPDAIVISATKGLEVHTRQRISEVIAEEFGAARPVVVLSGPSFAVEVARQLPTAVCAASRDLQAAALVQTEFRARYFRIYVTDDVVGVEIGAALKNVIAIAAGAVEGLGLGHNSLAALVTRGLAEISRLAGAVGGRRETLAGLSGLGDLVLTCTGDLSRNRFVGMELGKGRKLADILAGMTEVAEGVRTARSAHALGQKLDVAMPITDMVYRVLYDDLPAQRAVAELMTRDLKHELE